MATLKTQTMEHLRQLAAQIGPRPVGSAGNRAAGEYIHQVMAANGLEVTRQAYPCPDWEALATELTLDGRALAAAANPFSRPCDLTAPIVPLKSMDELRQSDLRGRIAVLHGALVKNGLTPSYAIYIFEPDPVVVLLEEKQPLAVITVNSRPGSSQPLIEDWAISLPSVTVSAEVGRELVCRPGEPARLRIDSRRTPSETWNVAGRLAGARRERIVVCAHYDTKHTTPGAFDNGSGAALLLALAEAWGARAAGGGPGAGLEFVALSGEEVGGTDVQAYLERNPDLGEILALINLDGIGDWLGTTSVMLMAGSPELEAEARELVQAFPGVVWVDPWYESDHSAFAFRGVPSFAVSSAGSADITHRPADDLDWIDPAKLDEALALVSGLIDRLQNRPAGWFRPAA